MRQGKLFHFLFLSYYNPCWAATVSLLLTWQGYRGITERKLSRIGTKLQSWIIGILNIHTYMYGHHYHKLLKSHVQCRLVLSLCRVILKLKAQQPQRKSVSCILMMCTIFSYTILSCKTFFEISFMCSVNLLSVLIECHRGDI